VTVILSFLGLGIILGLVVRRRTRILDLVNKAANWAVFLLIFFLGVSVGENEAVMKALGHLGLQALLLSSAAVLGSVLVSILVHRWFFKTAASGQSPLLRQR
jgi:uncharacterized membrane protein YbjE (DUF340 family)